MRFFLVVFLIENWLVDNVMCGLNESFGYLLFEIVIFWLFVNVCFLFFKSKL